MPANIHERGPQDARGGFTLPEVIIASSIGVLVVAAAMSTYIWCMEQTALCTKISWSQTEAMRSSGILTAYIRNASEIVAIDESEGSWVQLRFPDDSIRHLVYSNAVPLLRDGRMMLVQTDGVEVIVARGLTEIMDEGGFTTPIFQKVRDNSLRIQYRVAEPASTGGREVDDNDYAAAVRFSACLRNAEVIVEEP